MSESLRPLAMHVLAASGKQQAIEAFPWLQWQLAR
jgi:hypothetical protein